MFYLAHDFLVISGCHFNPLNVVETVKNARIIMWASLKRSTGHSHELSHEALNPSFINYLASNTCTRKAHWHPGCVSYRILLSLTLPGRFSHFDQRCHFPNRRHHSSGSTNHQRGSAVNPGGQPSSNRNLGLGPGLVAGALRNR